ncbi:MAG: CopG family transcriptional regulator [Deltaproteobacteria bacterium RIFOXYA12_FULL_61_11]|nr:MAG: CopG family transcriptional regulator [Deltaproteobacteria bacterium RIFOXYA12_FULL_61_11]
MGQVTIYLDDRLETAMKHAAKAKQLSTSKWIAQLIAERCRSEWPASVRQLAGAWKDLPTAEQLRNPQELDLPREAL